MNEGVHFACVEENRHRVDFRKTYVCETIFKHAVLEKSFTNPLKGYAIFYMWLKDAAS